MEDNILGFEITMDDLIFMHIIECFESLLNNIFS